MSVIAYYRGEIGSDSMGVCPNTGVYVPQQKLFGINHQLVIGKCGMAITLQQANDFAIMVTPLLAYLEHHHTRTRLLIPAKVMAKMHRVGGIETDDTLFIVTKRGCYIMDERRLVRVVNDLPVTSGSGGTCMFTALLMGYKMRSALTEMLNFAPLMRGEPVIVKQSSLRALSWRNSALPGVQALLNANAEDME